MSLKGNKMPLNKHDKLSEMIARHEGFRKYPYKCPAGKWTVGYGHNIEDNGISEKVASTLLKIDIGIAIKEVYNIIPKLYDYAIPRQHALIDLMFNIGMPAFLTFKKMIKAIKEEDWEKASAELKDSKYYRQTRSRSKEIYKILKTGEHNV